MFKHNYLSRFRSIIDSEGFPNIEARKWALLGRNSTRPRMSTYGRQVQPLIDANCSNQRPMSKQTEIIQALNIKSEINAKEEIRNRIDFLKAYCMKAGAKGFVLGISVEVSICSKGSRSE